MSAAVWAVLLTRAVNKAGLGPLCVPLQDIYIARAQGELLLEEELYAALISVYRSPAVLYELTRKHKRH